MQRETNYTTSIKPRPRTTTQVVVVAPLKASSAQIHLFVTLLFKKVELSSDQDLLRIGAGIYIYMALVGNK